jgi:adenine phosphoribosyltransferase
VQVTGRSRAQLASALDGRYGALDPAALSNAVEWLSSEIDWTGVTHVLGIPEGGLVPAFALAQAAAKLAVFATNMQPQLAGVLNFDVARKPLSTPSKHVYGLSAGDRVVIMEDEITSGLTVIKCVRALRAGGVACSRVAALYAADDPGMHEHLAAEGLVLHTVARFPVGLAAQLGDR